MDQKIVFIISKEEEGGYSARAVDYPIFTQGDTFEEVRANILDAIECHFEDEIEQNQQINIDLNYQETLLHA